MTALTLVTAFFALTAPALALDAGKVQAAIREGLEKDYHLNVSSVSCPMDAEYTMGQTITCMATDDEATESSVTVKIEHGKGADPSQGKLRWTPAKSIVALKPLGPILSRKLSEKLKKEAIVECEDKSVFKKDNCAMTCDATVGGEERLVSVTSCPDAKGNMNYKID